MKPSGMKIVAMIVSTFMISFMRMLTLDRCRSIRLEATSRSISTMSISWNTWSAQSRRNGRVPAPMKATSSRSSWLITLAHRPERAAQLQQVALERVDARDVVGPGASTTSLLHRLERLAVALEHREVAVDQRVEQGVGQVVGALAADPPLVLAQPLAHRVEAVARRAPGRSRTKPGAEDQRQLLGPQPIVEMGHAEDDEQMALVGLRPWRAG